MNHLNLLGLKVSRTALRLIVLPLFVILGLGAASAATVWDGPTMTFTKAPFADPALEENQDRLTANVWITRGSEMGLYNAKSETNYTHLSSPLDTEWAYGAVSNYPTLIFNTWEGMFRGSPGGTPISMVNQDVVLHLITDDIYLSVKFTSWSSGAAGGGGFTYTRSTPSSAQQPPPSPKLINTVSLGNGQVRFSFTNTPGYTFTILGTTNVGLALSNWTVLGSVTDSPAGFYQFTDTTAPANARRCYTVRWP